MGDPWDYDPPAESVYWEIRRMMEKSIAEAFAGPLLQPLLPRCECGAAKTGVADMAPGHSTWCPVAPEVDHG